MRIILVNAYGHRVSDPSLLPVPVVLLAATEAAERDSAILQALLELPGLTVLTHDLTEDEDEDGGTRTRRTVVDAGGTRSDVDVDLDHPCLGCLVREDLVPALAELHRQRPVAVLVALPLGADLHPVAYALGLHQDALAGYRLAGTVAVARDETVVDQLVGEDEDLLAHVVCADVIVLSDGGAGTVTPAATDLVDALRAAGTTVVPDVTGPWLDAALAGSLDVDELERRADPTTARRHHELDPATPTGKDVRLHTPQLRFASATLDIATSGVRRLVLTTDRPLHPERVMAGAQAFAAMRTVARGRFTVADRPGTVVGWQGVGGAITWGSPLGSGSGREPGSDDRESGTHLVVVGTGGSPVGAAAAFERMIANEAEATAARAGRGSARDPLAPYLGAADRGTRGTS